MQNRRSGNNISRQSGDTPLMLSCWLPGSVTLNEECRHSVPLCHAIPPQQQQAAVPHGQLPRHQDHPGGSTRGRSTGKVGYVWDSGKLGYGYRVGYRQAGVWVGSSQAHRLKYTVYVEIHDIRFVRIPLHHSGWVFAGKNLKPVKTVSASFCRQKLAEPTFA